MTRRTSGSSRDSSMQSRTTSDGVLASTTTNFERDPLAHRSRVGYPARRFAVPRAIREARQLWRRSESRTMSRTRPGSEPRTTLSTPVSRGSRSSGRWCIARKDTRSVNRIRRVASREADEYRRVQALARTGRTLASCPQGARPRSSEVSPAVVRTAARESRSITGSRWCPIAHGAGGISNVNRVTGPGHSRST